MCFLPNRRLAQHDAPAPLEALWDDKRENADDEEEEQKEDDEREWKQEEEK